MLSNHVCFLLFTVKAGLGSPPSLYTTNHHESMNKVVKASADHQKLSWIELTNKMFNLIDSQIKEIKKLVIGMGEYCFKPSYHSLELSSSQWFTMTTQQREKHLIKVSEKSCVPTESSSLCGEEYLIVQLSTILLFLHKSQELQICHLSSWNGYGRKQKKS